MGLRAHGPRNKQPLFHEGLFRIAHLLVATHRKVAKAHDDCASDVQQGRLRRQLTCTEGKQEYAKVEQAKCNGNFCDRRDELLYAVNKSECEQGLQQRPNPKPERPQKRTTGRQ